MTSDTSACDTPLPYCMYCVQLQKYNYLTFEGCVKIFKSAIDTSDEGNHDNNIHYYSGCGLDNFYDGGDDADEVLEKAAWLDSLSNGWLHTNLFQDFWSPPASAPTATPTRRTF